MFLVRGRSVDGTVWFAGHGSWTGDKDDAARLTQAEAEDAVEDRKERNHECEELESVIGRLVIVEE